MKILVSSINFHPDHSGIALYSTDLPVYLAEQQQQVTMVTGFSYYPTWVKLPADQGKLFRRETFKGVRTLRGYLYVPQKVTTAKRIIHELTFSSFAFLNFLRAGRQDCIVVISPPLTLGLVGVVFKWLWGAKLVFHIQDLQTDAALSLGMVKEGFMTRTLIRAENFIYRHSDHVATITEGMRERLVQKGIPREKLGLYYNWINVAETGRARPAGRFLAQHPALGGKWIIAYAGNMGVKQGVDVLISMAEALQSVAAIHVVIAGDGADKDRLIKLAGEKNLKNLTFLPFLSQEDYFDLLADIQVSFIAQRKGTGNVFFPSKLLGIMAMSKPVLISADHESELSTFVRRHQCGLTASAGDIGELAQAVRRLQENPALLEELGKNARNAVGQFDRETVLSRFLSWIKAAVTGGKNAQP